MRDYIEIKKELVPYQFDILLAEEWFSLYVNYNKTVDMYTISLYKDDELISTEPLVIGAPLFQDVYQPRRFPAITLVPYDSSGTAISVTSGSLGKTVFLTIDDEGDDNDETV